ncbi:MAG: phosphate/phosphite/phosphonate ABC transporter substrate-binding protein [Roseiflexaceae bacterium]
MRKFLVALLFAVVMTACGATAPAAEPTAAPAAEQPAQAEPTAAPAPTAAPEPTAEPVKEPIIIAWLPNESGADLKAARDAFGALITQATGREVEHRTTTDYLIAVEAVANNNADLAWFGAEAYVQAKAKNDAVVPLVIPSGASGTESDAVYYSWLAVNKGEEATYMKDGSYAIDNIQGKRFSFVSNSSTSGFRVPSAGIVKYFSKMNDWKDITADDLLEGGSDSFFTDVQFGGSHQGSAVNLISEKVDVAAFCDACVNNYVTIAEGEENVAGAVYKVNVNADEPFDKFPGKEFVIIQSVPVINAPFAANSSTLTAEEIKAIQDLLTSDEVANNTEIFAPKEVIDAGFKPFFRKTKDERFLVVPDSFFDPVRKLAE